MAIKVNIDKNLKGKDLRQRLGFCLESFEAIFYLLKETKSSPKLGRFLEQLWAQQEQKMNLKIEFESFRVAH